MYQLQDNEIDLFEFSKTLWGGKWILSALIMLFALIGFAYSHFAQPSYKVSLTYTINFFLVGDQSRCGRRTECLKSETTERLISHLGGGWRKQKNNVSLLLSSPKPFEASEYEAQTMRAIIALTDEAYLEAKDEVELIQTGMVDSIGTEVVAATMLNAKRVIQAVESGRRVINIASISVTQSAPKQTLIVALSALFGGVLGLVVVLVQVAINKRREQLTEA